MVQSGPDKQIGYLLRSYPRLSQTFVLNEILALEQLGVPIQIFALTNPREEVVQAQVGQVRAPVLYLDDAAPLRLSSRMLKGNAEVARRYFRGYLHALLYVAAGREIDRGYTSSSRWSCFLQAISLVQLLLLMEARPGGKPEHLHAHFAHDPTLVAYLVHCITGMPYSFTAHARDLYQVPEQALRDRIQEASAVVTCCRANMEYLQRVAPSQHSKISLVYHGVNLRDFQPVRKPAADSTPGLPLILSVGRLVEKKGFEDLLQALLLVKRSGGRFRCAIYGEGPLEERLSRLIEEHSLSSEVTLEGSRTQKELVAVFQSASLFVLTPYQTDDGDRDGIPNALLEAMAVGLPVITTAAGGIQELVENNRDGLLCQPHDVEGISSGIIELLHNPRKRSQLGSAASKKVVEQFDITRAARRLRALFVEGEPFLPADPAEPGRSTSTTLS